MFPSRGSCFRIVCDSGPFTDSGASFKHWTCRPDLPIIFKMNNSASYELLSVRCLVNAGPEDAGPSVWCVSDLEEVCFLHRVLEQRQNQSSEVTDGRPEISVSRLTNTHRDTGIRTLELKPNRPYFIISANLDVHQHSLHYIMSNCKSAFARYAVITQLSMLINYMHWLWCRD